MSTERRAPCDKCHRTGPLIEIGSGAYCEDCVDRAITILWPESRKTCKDVPAFDHFTECCEPCHLGDQIHEQKIGDVAWFACCTAHWAMDHPKSQGDRFGAVVRGQCDRCGRVDSNCSKTGDILYCDECVERMSRK